MSQEHDDDLRRAALYLGMDEKELANVRAEHAKYERRKAAMQYGDQGSPVLPADSQFTFVNEGCECGPLTFAPIQCSSCGIKITTQNHGDKRLCRRCLEESLALQLEAKRRFEKSQADYVAKVNAKASKAGRNALWTILPAVIGLIGVVFLVKWLWEASK